MKAAVYHGKGDLRVEQVPIPKIKPGHIKVRVEFCGICGSDLHEYLAGPLLCPPKGHPHPLTNETIPLVMGHEFAGVVDEIGEGITKFKVGENVCGNPLLFDGTCYPCRHGKPNACDKIGFVGLMGGGGAFSKYIVLPEHSVYHLKNIPTDIGALVEPLSVAWHAVVGSGFQAGQDAIICGAGPIGCATVLALKANGARRVIMVELAAARKAQAKEFGADFVLDPKTDDVIARAKELCDGLGPHMSYDAAGIQATIDVCIKSVRAGGTIWSIAVWEKPHLINPDDLMKQEKKYTGGFSFTPEDYTNVLNALHDGRIKPGVMITAKIKLDDILKNGFEELIHNKEKHIKILVSPE